MLSFLPSLTTAIHSTTIYLLPQSIGYNMSKMPLLELLFRLSNTTTTYYLLFENCTGYLFNNALLTKLLPLLSKLCISISHPTFMNCSLPIIPHVSFGHPINIYYLSLQSSLLTVDDLSSSLLLPSEILYLLLSGLPLPLLYFTLVSKHIFFHHSLFSFLGLIYWIFDPAPSLTPSYGSSVRIVWVEQ